MCEVVEWTYLSQGTSKTGRNKTLSRSRKTRNEKLEKFTEKFDPLVNKKQSHEWKKELVQDPQEESSSRANRLKSVVNKIRGKKKIIVIKKNHLINLGDDDVMDKSQREDLIETQNEALKESQYHG